RSDLSKRWLIIEHQTGLVLFFTKIFRILVKCKPVLIHGIYAEDCHYYVNKVWRKDGSTWIDKKQDKYYVSRWRKRLIRQWMYIKTADAVISNSQRVVKMVTQEYHIPTFHIYNSISKEEESVRLDKR